MLCKNAQKRVEYRSISPKIWALKRIDSVAIYDRRASGLHCELTRPTGERADFTANYPPYGRASGLHCELNRSTGAF